MSHKPAILPDPYWAGMITGRVVHQHLTLVEEQLCRAHRAIEDRLLAGRAATAVVSRLDGTSPADRVLARVLDAVSGTPLPETVALFDGLDPVPVDRPGGRDPLSVLVFGDSADTVLPGLRRALAEVETHGLAPVVELGVGLVGVGAPPPALAAALDRECVFLAERQWAAGTPDLTALVLDAAARSLARMWGDAEILAYGLDTEPAAVPALVDAFAAGVVAEYRRAGGDPVPDRVAEPVQETALPLLSELVRCWWPRPERATNLFGSPFDYMSTLEPARAAH